MISLPTNLKTGEMLAPEYGGYILLKPRHSIAVIVKEAVNLPNDILGRILTKVVCFRSVLCQSTLYADPVFLGT